MRTIENPMNAKPSRIIALDGLRGLAILFVIGNHMRLGQLYAHAPSWLHPVIGLFASNGGTGVLLLFMLSGYLMATLYPNVQSISSFLQKRYTRIFPAFIVMCIALAAIRMNWDAIPNYLVLGIVTICIMIGGALWRLLQKLPIREKIGKGIFISFFCLQIITIIGYLFLQLKIPSAVYYADWTLLQRTVVNTLVNLTMTIPFGTYVGQLDGVFWSVIAEVTFYLLYPIFILPSAKLMLSQKNIPIKIFALICLFPFCFSFYIFFKNIYFFSMLQFNLVLYFIGGVIIGLTQHSLYISRLFKFVDTLPKLPTFFLTFLCIVGSIWAPGDSITKNLYWVLPLSLGFILTLHNNSLWAKMLSLHFFTYLGTISYSLYLIHTIIIEIFVRNGEPTTIPMFIMSTIPTLVFIYIFARLLNENLEKPYFAKPNRSNQIKTPLNALHRNTFPSLLYVSILAILLWFSYRPISAFFTHTNDVLVDSFPSINPITSTPLVVPFYASDDNLGMIQIAIRPLTDKELQDFSIHPGRNFDASLVAEIKNAKNELISKNLFSLHQIFNGNNFPLGLPVEAQSKGNKYSLSLYIDDAKSAKYMGIVSTDKTIRLIYMLDKKATLSNLKLFANLIFEKITAPFASSEAKLVLLNLMPLSLLLIVLSIQEKRNVFVHT